MKEVRRILVFRVGYLGDTLVALPSLQALRKNFPAARITLLHDRPDQAKFIPVEELLKGTGLVDDYLSYPVLRRSSRPGLAVIKVIGVLTQIWARRFDLIVHLVAGGRTPAQDTRDKWFFRLAGIHRQITTSVHRPSEPPHRPLAPLPQEADFLLAGLERAGLQVPPAGQATMELRLGADEDAEVNRWEAETGLASDKRTRVAFALGGKTPAQRWPRERYGAVAKYLVDRWNVMPVVFGGMEDSAGAAELISACGRGASACGKLSVRAAARALRDCAIYVGNDTGTMHLAAAVGVPCVVAASARNPPGRWFPYGNGHKVHRLAVSCEGCRLDVCTVERLRCLTGIEPEEVIRSCEQVLQRQPAPEKA